MKIQFYKYQGTGNDFILLDNRNGEYVDLSIEQIRGMCDRRFGIGADGLIRINSHKEVDFEMDYFNSDGSKSFCGNGARCAVAFAGFLGIEVSQTTFMAIDGIHDACFSDGIIYLKMKDVADVAASDTSFVVNTGSPHFMQFVADVKKEDIVSRGREIRYSDSYKRDGINVNLIEQLSEDAIRIRTYERGVEDETLSCGTGATACALVLAEKNGIIGSHRITVDVEGGQLQVAFNRTAAGSFTDIELIGPAEFVFKGEIHV